MNSKYYDTATVGEIVSDNFNAANVFEEFGIDFCCHGNTPFVDAVKNAGLNAETIEEAIDKADEKPSEIPDFRSWPLDRITEYIVEIYHTGIRVDGPKIKALLNRVVSSDGAEHPVLMEVQELFEMSMMDLLHHIEKEEMVLFPYIGKMCEAQRNHRPLPLMHCGSIANPIEVMMMEHETEEMRYKNLADLTGNFTTPADASANYRKLMALMRDFNDKLHQHMHIENNILFPAAKHLEFEMA